MKEKKFCLLFLLAILSGCVNIYISSPRNIPLFEEKGEVQIEVGANVTDIFVTGSYAFSDKYALIANGSLSYQNFLDLRDTRGMRYSETTLFYNKRLI